MIRAAPAFAGAQGTTSSAPATRRRRVLWEDCSMLDTHAVARSLTAADFTPAQADALTDALRSAVEHGDHVTSDQFKAGQAELRAEIANLDTRLSTQISEVRTEIANLDTRLSTQISEVRTEVANLDTRLSTQMSRIEADLKSDMKLLKFGYGPVVLGLLVKLVFFP